MWKYRIFCNYTNGVQVADIYYCCLHFSLAFPEDFIRSKKGNRCQKNNLNVLKKFKFPDGFVNDAFMALDECEKYCATKENCWGCAVYCNGGDCQINAITECGSNEKWTGLIDGDISQKPGRHPFMYGF